MKINHNGTFKDVQKVLINNNGTFIEVKKILRASDDKILYNNSSNDSGGNSGSGSGESQEESANKYKISFNVNGGYSIVGYSDIVFTSDTDTHDLPNYRPERDDYYFGGWSNSNISSESNKRIAYTSSHVSDSGWSVQESYSMTFSVYCLKLNININDLPIVDGYRVLTLYAQWVSASSIYYTIKVYSPEYAKTKIEYNGTSEYISNSSNKTYSILKNSIVTLTQYPDDGYIFNGWEDGSSYRTRLITVTKNDEYWSFTLRNQNKKYKIIFNTNTQYEEIINTITLESANSTTNISSSVPSAYLLYFAGWSSVKKFNLNNRRIAYSYSTISNSRLSATYTESNWTIYEYCIYTGTNMNNLPYVDGYYVLTLYAQWVNTRDKYPFAVIAPEHCKILASYTNSDYPNGRTLEFEAGTGSTYALDFNLDITLLAVVDSGYSFGEWYDGDTSPTKTVTLNGNFNIRCILSIQKVSGTVTIDLNGGEWKKSSTKMLGYTVYESKDNVPNSGYAPCKLIWNNINDFNVKIMSYAEGGIYNDYNTSSKTNYDFMIAYTPESSLIVRPDSQYVRQHTCGMQSAYIDTSHFVSDGNFRTVDYSDKTSSWAWIIYTKDSSGINGADKGYLAISNKYNIIETNA